MQKNFFLDFTWSLGGNLSSLATSLWVAFVGTP